MQRCFGTFTDSIVIIRFKSGTFLKNIACCANWASPSTSQCSTYSVKGSVTPASKTAKCGSKESPQSKGGSSSSISEFLHLHKGTVCKISPLDVSRLQEIVIKLLIRWKVWFLRHLSLTLASIKLAYNQLLLFSWLVFTW